MNPFEQVLSIIFQMYMNIVLLRFFLQYFRADFYNPLSQFVVKLTDPLIKPLRRIIPGFGGIDFSSLVLAWLVAISSIVILGLISGGLQSVGILLVLIVPVFQVIGGAFDLFMFLVIVRAIMSWFMTGGYNPIFAVIGQLTEPLLSKCRKILPPMSGLDLSPLIAILGLMFISSSIDYYIVPAVLHLVQ